MLPIHFSTESTGVRKEFNPYIANVQINCTTDDNRSLYGHGVSVCRLSSY